MSISNTSLQCLEGLNPARLRIAITAFGAIIAGWICYIQHGWINNDTVLYLEAARLFADGEWKNGFEIFPWPLYSLLIALVHQITTFSLHFSAQLLSVTFFATTTYFLIRLITLSGGNNLAVAAGALILFSSHYVVGDVLEMLMRDQGFWAFFLASLVFFIQFCRTKRWQHSLLWQTCIIIATLFRIEGITYLIGLPLLLLLNRDISFKHRLTLILKAQALPVVAVCSLLIAFQLNQHLNMQDMGRLSEIFTWDLLSQLTEQFKKRSQIMADQVLGNFLDGYAIQGLMLVLTFVILSKIISSAGIINIGLATFSMIMIRKNPLAEPQALRVLVTAILIALINAQLTILKVFVLSSRYIVPLILLLMIFAALGLAQLTDNENLSSSRKKHGLLIFLSVIFTLGLVKNLLPKQAGYNFHQEAVEWIKKNNTYHEPVYYFDARLRHYAGVKFIGSWNNPWQRLNDEIDNHRFDHYEYLVINIEPEDGKRLLELTSRLSQFKAVSKHYGPRKKKYVLILRNIEN